MSARGAACGAWLLAAALCCGTVLEAAAGGPAIRFHTGPGTLWAEAWVGTERGQSALWVRLRNHTLKDVQMSFVGDEYIAQLKDGSLESLKKLDFFHYPTVLTVGGQATVRLGLPPKRRIDDMIALVIRLDQGRTVLALNPPASAARVAAMAVPPAAPFVPATEPVPTVTMPPTPSTIPKVLAGPPLPEARSHNVSPLEVVPPAAPPAAAPAAPPLIALPLTEAPVVVEFTQDLGGSLTLQVAWDEGEPSGAVRPGERKVFRVAPGPHVCRLSSGVLGLAATTGTVPLVIGKDPARLIIRASVTLDGVTLRVEAWNNVTNDLLLERTFEPGA